MRKKIVYENVPLGKIKIIPSFLPEPEELVFKEETVEVKVPFKRRSIEFFKRQAREQRVPYQQIIRALVDNYASHFDR